MQYLERMAAQCTLACLRLGCISLVPALTPSSTAAYVARPTQLPFWPNPAILLSSPPFQHCPERGCPAPPLLSAVDAYLGGSALVGKVTAGNFVGSELAGASTLIAFDNTLMNANQWSADAMTTLATSVGAGHR